MTMTWVQIPSASKSLLWLLLDQKKCHSPELRSPGHTSQKPPCPEPDKAIGFAPHSDADALTVVFQLNQTQGLEIRKDGNWVPVVPLEKAFIVNIGDIMEIVSNGVYRSVEHRAIVNSTKERLSVATFYSSNFDSELGPAKSIIGPANPSVFRTELAELYHKGFFARKLSGKSYLQEMRL